MVASKDQIQQLILLFYKSLFSLLNRIFIVVLVIIGLFNLFKMLTILYYYLNTYNKVVCTTLSLLLNNKFNYYHIYIFKTIE